MRRGPGRRIDRLRLDLVLSRASAEGRVRVAHGDEGLAGSFERSSSMSGKHVVHQHQVSPLPLDPDGAGIRGADLLERLRVDLRTVAVIRVARKILWLEQPEHPLTHARVKAGDVKEVSLIEPHAIS